MQPGALRGAVRGGQHIQVPRRRKEDGMYKTAIAASLALMLAGPVAAQERTTTDEGVRAVLADLKDWPPDTDAVPSKVARKWKKNKGARDKYARLFAEGGELQSIDFIDAFDVGDAYLIEFENARVLLVFRTEPKKRWTWRAMVRLRR